MSLIIVIIIALIELLIHFKSYIKESFYNLFNICKNVVVKIEEEKEVDKVEEVVVEVEEIQTNTKKFSTSLTDRITRINKLIVNDLSNIKDEKLRNILEYATSGGKRVRGIIIDSILSDSKKQHIADEAILFIEYIHASSLIMDDIMDKDKTRRGLPCTYIKYGDTLSQLASIILVTIAFKHFKSILKVRYTLTTLKQISTLFIKNYFLQKSNHIYKF